MLSAQRKTKMHQIAQEDVSCGDSDEDYNPGEERSRPVTERGPKSRASKKVASKQKQKRPEKRRNTGKLSKLPDMPLDILYEIFSLVHPGDLLRVSWASKALRSVLTNKSSRQVWVATFNNIPEAQRPPPCPEELTEISYANILYNLHCTVCGATRATLYWMALARLCTGCIEERVTVAGGVQDRAVVRLSHNKLRSSSQVLPYIYIKVAPLPTKVHVFTKDLEQLTADLKATDDQAAVIQRYKDALVARSEFGRAIEKVEKVEKAEKEAVIVAAHDRRIEQILERLADEGWDEEISSHREDYVRCLVKVKGVKVARPLTEKAWKKMEVQVLNAMQARKNIRKKSIGFRF